MEERVADVLELELLILHRGRSRDHQLHRPRGQHPCEVAADMIVLGPPVVTPAPDGSLVALTMPLVMIQEPRIKCLHPILVFYPIVRFEARHALRLLGPSLLGELWD